MCTSQHLIPYILNTSIVIQLLDIARKLCTLSLHALYLEANINNAAITLFAKTKRLFCPESEESRRHSIGANSVKLKSFCRQTSTLTGHAPLENLKKIEVQRCNLMHFEAYGNRKINVNLRQPVSIFHGKVHNLRES